jgi:outer membrane protein assembly factor BamB
LTILETRRILAHSHGQRTVAPVEPVLEIFMMSCARRRDRRMYIANGFTRCVVHGSLVATLLVSISSFGCSATNNNNAENARPANAAPRTGTTPEQTIAAVERQYVIGPIAAEEMGYNVQWQFPDAGRDLKLLHVQGDSVFALDRNNFLTRIDRENGRRIWRMPTAEPIQEIIAINYIDDRVYLTAGGRIIVLDAVTGSQVGLQRLAKIANTPPVQYGQFLIYGSRDGQIIWHSYPVEYQWRAYQVAPSIQISPVQQDGHLVTIGSNGRVAVHNANNASMLWDKQLLSSVVARPAVSSSAVYVAGLDQHLWAYDLRTGRNLWRHLTESPLRQAPVLINDTVYQHVPARGLVAFEALPLDSPGGRIRWSSEQITGNVLAARNSRLLVWSASDKQLIVADERRGGIMKQLNLRQTDRLVAHDTTGRELYAVSNDGRIVRLLARN